MPDIQDKELNENIYSMWGDEDASEKKSLRASILVAVIMHAMLLAITFPALFTPEVAAAKDKKIFVVPTYRFKPPPPEPDRVPPKLRAKEIPIPDPTPDAPEPFVEEKIEISEIDVDPDTIFTDIPEPPPMPVAVDKIFQVGEVAKPERIHYVNPLYTEIARRARIEGTVFLQAIIDTQGNVTNVTVLKGLSMGLTEEAIKALRQWRYKPSTHDGRPVSVQLTLTVRFQLQ